MDGAFAVRLVVSNLVAASLVALLAACGSSSSDVGFGVDASVGDQGGGGGGGDLGGGGALGGGCAGPGCGPATSCPGGGKTTLSGTVYDPAGKNPLYDVVVFVPTEPPPALHAGATCDQCGATVTKARVSTITAPDGTFVLEDVPAGDAVPIVFQVGKWRRQITAKIDACKANVLADKSRSRLPRDASEGDMPQMAIATGSIDPFECLLRKIGIADAEFTAPSGKGHVHMYQQNGGVLASGAVPGSQLYGSVDTLKKYDVVIFPCEATPVPKDAAAIQNLVDYTSAGGRVFATHYSYTWLNALAPFDTTATFSPNQAPLVDPNATVDTSFPKGAAFAKWLSVVGASTAQGKLNLQQVRFDVTGVNVGSQRWISSTPTFSFGGAKESIQHYTFNTPVGVDASKQCGRVVYSDFHVVADSASPLPGGVFPEPLCGSKTDMLPQEKALEFMLFDLSACIQNDQLPPQPPPR